MNNIFAAAAYELDRTVASAKSLLSNLTNAETSTRTIPGKRSKKEILGHLLDSASNNHQRFVRAGIQGSLVFPGYPQDKLVELQNFREMDWEFLVEFWAGYNRYITHVLKCMPANTAEVICNIGDNKPATLGWIAEDYVAHLKHHLNQIVGNKFQTAYGVKA